MSAPTDCQFPHIFYNPKDSPRQWGHAHGESFRDEIKELAHIRRDLMISKNPQIKESLSSLAQKQAQSTEEAYPKLYHELLGIKEGANCKLEDLIILNNYTDFRDIHLPEQGCTSLGLSREEQVSGQTWDMHASAKNYVCTIELPGRWIVYSLVGCLGMMGANKEGLFIGVNNINTVNALARTLWPSIVRHLLQFTTLEQGRKELLKAPFSSGHNYLLSDGKSWENWECSPHFQHCCSKLEKNEKGLLYHTNHCLHPNAQEQEESISQNSTTFDRYKIVEKRKNSLQNTHDMIALFHSHEGYPKSICGHYQSGIQDPSITCGGGVFNHEKRSFFVWRGCKIEDENYKERTHFIE